MKTYTVLYAEDVPHYGSHDIKAKNDQAAIEAAVALHRLGGVSLTEANWDGSFCARIVHIEDPDGNIIEVDKPLDDYFVRSGGRSGRLLCENAEDLLTALETLMEKADNLQAAIEGVTDQFEAEVSALSEATSAAEKIAKTARGGS